MLSVVIPTLNSEEALARTLASLIAAAADGLVREVVIIDGGSSDVTRAVADGTGCQVLKVDGGVASRLRAGAEVARRGDWLMFVMPGVVFDDNWFNDFRGMIERWQRRGQAPSALVFGLGIDDTGLSAGFRLALSRLRTALSGTPSPDQGLLLPRSLYAATGGIAATDRSLRALCRRVGRRRIQRMRVEAVRILGDGQVAHR